MGKTLTSNGESTDSTSEGGVEEWVLLPVLFSPSCVEDGPLVPSGTEEDRGPW